MKTKDLILLTDWIRANSLAMSWYRNDQMWGRHEMKDGKFHGDSKNWRYDGTLWYHAVLDNGRFIKHVI